MPPTVKLSEQNKKSQEDQAFKDKQQLIDLASRHLSELKKIQEESIAREQKFAKDLDARYIEELKKIKEETATNEREFKNDLNSRYAIKLKEIQTESAEREKQLLSDFEARHDQVLKRIQEEGLQREKSLLEQWKIENESRNKDLLTALMAARTGRNRTIWAVSWISIGMLVVMCTTGYMHGNLPTVLVLMSMGFFSLAIIFAGQNTKYNDESFQAAVKDGNYQRLGFDEHCSKSVRSFFIALISMAFLGLFFFLNFLGKSDARQQTGAASSEPTPSSQQPVAAGQGASTAPQAAVSATPADVSSNAPAAQAISQPAQQAQNTSSDSNPKTAGNGGNFAGGNFKQ